VTRRDRWHLALSAQSLRNADCERTMFLWQRECRKREDMPRRTQWCLRCRTLDRLERLGFTEPERPSDREFREAMERGEVFEIVENGS